MLLKNQNQKHNCDMLGKPTKGGGNPFLQVGLPLITLVVAGSVGLSVFVQTKYDIEVRWKRLRSIVATLYPAQDSRRPVLNHEAEPTGVPTLARVNIEEQLQVTRRLTLKTHTCTIHNHSGQWPRVRKWRTSMR